MPKDLQRGPFGDGYWPLATPVILDSFVETRRTPEQMDQLWRHGWRHFGPEFVRYSWSEESGHPLVVQPLRIVLERYSPSKSQRRIFRRNADVTVRFQPPQLDAERHRLFDEHKMKFPRNIPRSLASFLGEDLSKYPCENVEVAAYLNERLIAASYLDIGREGASSLYGMFCLKQSRRGLGIATMLWEMEYARKRGCRYYYPGYAFHEPSALDYKKQFAGVEWYDWHGNWIALK